MGKTTIEWCDVVWNPVTGCTKVSQGCKNCYAERVATRFWKGRKFSEVQCHPERLEELLHWKKPRRVLVNSMSDLFHEAIDFEFIGMVFDEMICHPKHMFMVLTKRPEQMARFASWYGKTMIAENIWLGVSVEDQKTADERIPYLLRIPAAFRFLSCEPLLGPIDLLQSTMEVSLNTIINANLPRQSYFLEWVICGGESGPCARPMHPDWARKLLSWCIQVDVPFFFKQWGEWLPDDQMDPKNRRDPIFETDMTWAKVGKKKAGRLLDGREWNEFPEVKK